MRSHHPLRIPEEIAARIREHGAESYPYECCGALLGRESDGGRRVVELLPLANRRHDSLRNRFSISPEDYRRAEQVAAERELELLGWYHSHPDHPALPSEFDREHAWPWFSYVIVSVEQGKAGPMVAWRLADDRSRFRFEEIVVEAGARV